MACFVREHEVFRRALLHGMRFILWSVFCLHLHVLLCNVSSNGPWIKQTKTFWLPEPTLTLLVPMFDTHFRRYLIMPILRLPTLRHNNTRPRSCEFFFPFPSRTLLWPIQLSPDWRVILQCILLFFKAAKNKIQTITCFCTLWRRVESYHAYVPSSKLTLWNDRGSLLVTDYKDHTIWAG